MDIAQLRYPVAYWDGNAPVHRITALAITPPVHRAQRVLLFDESQPHPTAADSLIVNNVHHTNGDAGNDSEPQPPPAPQQPRLEVKQYAITCAESGEIVHWEIHPQPPPHAEANDGSASASPAHVTSAQNGHSSPTSSSLSPPATQSIRTFHPRALLLRQGSARLTVCVRVCLGELDTFLVGSVEGFLTLWTATAGRCVKSALVLPFAPSVLVPYQREARVRVGRTVEHGLEKGGVSRSVTRSYCVCASVQSPYVYVVSLPQLKVVKILKHAYEVAHVTLITVAVKRPTATAAATTSTANNTKGPTKHTASSASSASASATVSPAKPTVNTASSMRATLHCLTIGGTLHRWDMLDLTAQDGPAAALPTQPEDESNRELLLTRTKASVIKLPFPSIALPTGIPVTTDPASPPASAASQHSPTSAPLLSLQPLSPVSCALSGSGNLMLVALQRDLCVYSMVTRQLETPLISLHRIVGDDAAVREECVFAGCQFLPSFSLSSVLILRVLVWTTTGDVRLLQISTTAAEEGKRVLVEVLAEFVVAEHSGQHAGGRSEGVAEPKELAITVSSEDERRHGSRRQSTADAGLPIVPTSFVVDGDRIVGGNAAGEVIEWLMPAHLVPHLTAATYTSPLSSTDASALTLVPTPSFPASPIVFQLAVQSSLRVTVLPCHRSSIAAAFSPAAISERLSLTSSATDPCICSVVLTEGSGKAILLARGFTSGLIRVYGPASRSPASPSPSTSRASSFSSFVSSHLPSLSPSNSFTTEPSLLPSAPPDATVLDFRAHSAAITALLSIGGREFSCNHCMMASGSADMTVGIWDVSRATLLKRIRLTSAVSSLHKPALTDDDFYYYAVESRHGRRGGGSGSGGRSRADSGGLNESRIKEEYQHQMDSKPFVTLDAQSPRSADSATELDASHLSTPTPPPTRSLRPLVTDDEDDSQASAGLGTLFVSSADGSVRVYSLSSYLLLQTFRGHDSPVLSVFRDAACAREEQVIVQTERHSMYVWSMVEGTLDLYMRGDEGALPFLQMRGLIAPGSQLSILAHHVRQRMKRLTGGGSDTKGGGHESEEEDGDRLNSNHDTSGAKHEEEKEKEKDSHHAGGSLRDKFHLRSRSFANLSAAHHTSSSSSSSTSSTSANSASTSAAHHVPHVPGFPSSAASSPVHSQHTPSSQALLHPASSFLSQHRPIDRTTQHLLLSSIVKADSGGVGGGDASSHSSELPHSDSSDGLAHFSATTPRAGGLPKPNLLKRASTIIEKGADKVRGDMTKERMADEHDSGAPSSASGGTGGGGQSAESTTYDLHIPLIDPYMGTKKLRHTIDAVRLDGKAHLHVSLFIINLNRFIRDIEKRSLHYQRQRSQPASPRSAAVPTTPHAPSVHHLAVEALDPTPQSELNYLLSTLFDWDENSATTAMLRQHFQVHSPFPVPCYAAITDNSQAMTVLFPSYCQGWRRWQLDADMTARQALSIAAVCMPLLASADVTSQTYFSKIVAHYGSILPTHLVGYVEPDVSVLALFSVNSNEHVQSSARLLLQGVVERATTERRREMSELWSTYYTYAVAVDKSSGPASASASPPGRRDTSPTRDSGGSGIGGYVSDQEMMTALVLTLIGLTELAHSRQQHGGAGGGGEAADEAAAREQTLATFDVVAPHIANTLMRVVNFTGSSHDNDTVKCILAADLLSRSLPLFLPHIGRPETLIHRLYLLSMAKSQSLAATAYRCLLEYGKLDPHSFLASMGREALSARNSSHVRQSAFQSIIALVKRHSLSLARALPAAVAVCVQALDAKKEPEMRRTLMNSSLAALHALDQHYPLVALHHGTQRFAVAANSPRPTIVLYDLNRGDRMRTIEAGKGEVSAVGWSVHGGLIAAYAASDSPPSVRVWSVSEAAEPKGGLFGRLIGKAGGGDSGSAGKEKDGGDKCVKVFALPAIAPPSRTNSYYTASHTPAGQRWAEDEDKGVRLRRSKSKSQLAAGRRSLTVGRAAGSASASPATTPPVSPLALPEDDEGEVVLDALGDKGGKEASAGVAAGSGAAEDEEEEEDVVRQLVLKSMLTARIEWKGDTELIITRENGDRKTLTL